MGYCDGVGVAEGLLYIKWGTRLPIPEVWWARIKANKFCSAPLAELTSIHSSIVGAENVGKN